MEPEQRLAVLASLALLLTMFFPWYGLQSLNRKTGTINSKSINAFGDVSFVEAAVFLVAAGVVAMVLARAEGLEFHLPGGDGTIAMIAGAWAGLLIFYRVFDRPAGHGYPVGIEWGFFLAFVAAGSLAYAGWRMRIAERPEPPLLRRRARPQGPRAQGPDMSERPIRAGSAAPARRGAGPEASEHPAFAPAPAVQPRPPRSAPVGAGERPRYPPPPEQLSFEDPPPDPDLPTSARRRKH
ncbi:MAG: hypothetical protein ABSG95_02435 [Solirubrobacteraceae bacterium]|jgi:hypothetical protein